MITPAFEILNQKGTPMFNSDLTANIPAAGVVGRVFIATDSPYGIFRDNGTTWDQIAGGGGGGISGSGTATQVTFWTGASSVGSDSNLYWDNVNKRLGINTASPSSPLDIHTTGVGATLNGTGTNNSFLAFQNAGTGRWQIGNVYSGATNYFRIFDVTNSVERLAIQNTGAFTFTGFGTVTDSRAYSTGTSEGLAIGKTLTIAAATNFSGTSNIGGITAAAGNTFAGNTTLPNSSTFNALLAQNNINFSGVGTLTITQATGIRAATSLQTLNYFGGTASGTITHFAAHGIYGYFNLNTGAITPVITNAYQLLINNINDYTHTFTFTNRWGIYQNGANDNNYFAGKVNIGTNVISTSLLYVNGLTTIKSLNTTTSSFRIEQSGGTSTLFNFNGNGQLYIGTTSFPSSIGSVNDGGIFIYNQSDGNSNISYLKIGTANTMTTIFNQKQVEIIQSYNTGVAAGTSTDLLFSGTINGLATNIHRAIYINKTITSGDYRAIESSVGGGYFNTTSVSATAILQADSVTKGFLQPRQTSAQLTAISSPANGLQVYKTDGYQGKYVYMENEWLPVADGTELLWWNGNQGNSAIVAPMTTQAAGTGAAVGFNTLNLVNTKTHSVSLATGTTSTGSAGIYTAQATGMNNGTAGNKFCFRYVIVTPSALSNATDTYTLTIGNGILPPGQPALNTFGFYYTHGTNAGAWTLFWNTIAGGSATSGVTVAINTQYVLEIEFTLGTNIRYYINGSLVLTQSAGIPTALGAGYLSSASIVKSAGTTSVTCYAASLLARKLI